MQHRSCFLLIALAVLPSALAAQGTPATTAAAPPPAPAPAVSTSPVADALRQMEQRFARNLIAAAEAMPADKYKYRPDRKSTRLNSSHLVISYAVFCLKKKKISISH